MNEDDVKYYESLVMMFQSEGWKNFMKEYQTVFDTTLQQAPYTALTNDQWQYDRGYMAALRNVLGFESYIKAILENDSL